MNRRPFFSERALALAFASIRTAVCAYRAAAQSMVHDEALTFNDFVSGSWHDVYFRYQVNNHVLFSLLAKLSTVLLGSSEFALRLPSVIAGFFLMVGTWRILEHAKSRAARWIAFAAIGLHPLTLDFSVAARGYGLALAFTVWAVYAVMKERNIAAGFLLGLGMAANLTVGSVAAGLIVAVFLLEKSFRSRARGVVAIALPSAAVVLAIYAGVFRLMARDTFAAGDPRLRDSLIDLTYASILATPRAGLIGTRAAAGVLAFWALPVVLVFIGATSLFAWRKGDRWELVPAVALGSAAVGIVGAHILFGMNYPIDRTGLVLMVLFGIVWALAAGNTSSRLLRAVNLLLGALLAIQFATQFHTSYFQVWWYDRSTKAIAHAIEQEIRGEPAGSISIGASWIHRKWRLNIIACTIVLRL